MTRGETASFAIITSESSACRTNDCLPFPSSLFSSGLVCVFCWRCRCRSSFCLTRTTVIQTSYTRPADANCFGFRSGALRCHSITLSQMTSILMSCEGTKPTRFRSTVRVCARARARYVIRVRTYLVSNADLPPCLAVFIRAEN